MRRVKDESDKPDRKHAVKHVLRTVTKNQVKMLAPFTPHLCEEIWESLGNESFVSFAPWPKANEELFKPDAEELEEAIKTSLEDVQKIIRVTKITPTKINFYVATSWKWKVYLKALKLTESGELGIGALIVESFKDEELKTRAKAVPSFARSIMEDVKKTPAKTVKRRINMGMINEHVLLQDAEAFFRNEFRCDVTISEESDPWIHDPEKRATRAKPYRPAIYVE